MPIAYSVVLMPVSRRAAAVRSRHHPSSRLPEPPPFPRFLDFLHSLDSTASPQALS
ncbi:hypothetical protein [Streptomyces sp. NPDC059071]|uniref:hypothetical protein n=1 Tax=unclassified Streptomyces TaxID=2593676 RepID=UPI00364A7A06